MLHICTVERQITSKDTVKTGHMLMRLNVPSILAVFPCQSCENKLTGGPHSSDHAHTRELHLFLGTAPPSHTCTIPPGVSGDIFFPANSVHMRPVSSLFVVWALRDQDPREKSLLRFSEKSNRRRVSAEIQIRRI